MKTANVCGVLFFFPLAFIKSKGWNNHATPRRMQLFQNLPKIKHENIFKHPCWTNKTPPCLATRCLLPFQVVACILEHRAISQGLRALPVPGNPASPRALWWRVSLATEHHRTRQPTWHLEGASWVWAGRRVRVRAAAAPRRVGVTAVGRMRKRMAVGLLERIREGGVEWHVRLVLP